MRVALARTKVGSRRRATLLIALLAMAGWLLMGGAGSANASQGNDLTIPQGPPPATLGQAYSAQLHVVGGVAPYTFTSVADGFPDGLAVSSSGIVSGTPLVPGYSSINVTITDSSSPHLSGSTEITLEVDTGNASLDPTVVPLASQLTGQLGGAPNGGLGAVGGVLGTIEGLLPPPPRP